METFETLHLNKGEDVLPLLFADLWLPYMLPENTYPLLYQTASLFFAALTNNNINKVCRMVVHKLVTSNVFTYTSGSTSLGYLFKKSTLS